jgi:hypothetical protein
MREVTAQANRLGVEGATNAVLREAGGGRVAGVRLIEGLHRTVYAVQFVRGDWLCTAAVDAGTGVVTSIVNDGDGTRDDPGPLVRPRAEGVLTLDLGHRTIGDLAASAEDPAVVYVATDAGVSCVRVGRHGMYLLTGHVTGLGATRQVAVLPGGVAGITSDGWVFRLRADRVVWQTRVPGVPYTVAAGPGRVLVATNAGGIELDIVDGRELSRHEVDGGPARAGAYLPSGERVLVSHHGTILVLPAGAGAARWRFEQGEYPERVWAAGDRMYVAGEGGLKEIVPGEGVVGRWSTPMRDTVKSAVLAGGRVYTCAPGLHLAVHGYAAAAYAGHLDGLPDAPEVTAPGRDPSGAPLLLAGHRGGLISAHRL